MKFKSNVRLEDIINRYGVDRVREAKTQLLQNSHIELCWFFIADYCNDTKVSPFYSENYDFAHKLFTGILNNCDGGLI